MGRDDPCPIKYTDASGNIIFKSKYNTEYKPREKLHPVHFNSAPHNQKYVFKDNKDAQKDSKDTQKEYIKHNLFIKCRIDAKRPLQQGMKKPSIRDYTPKILKQEINLNMWI